MSGVLEAVESVLVAVDAGVDVDVVEADVSEELTGIVGGGLTTTGAVSSVLELVSCASVVTEGMSVVSTGTGGATSVVATATR